MKTSAICHICGNVTEADYIANPRTFDTVDTHGTKTQRIVRIHCRLCGDHERPPRCLPDLADAKILQLLVL